MKSLAYYLFQVNFRGLWALGKSLPLKAASRRPKAELLAVSLLAKAVWQKKCYEMAKYIDAGNHYRHMSIPLAFRIDDKKKRRKNHAPRTLVFRVFWGRGSL